MTESEAERGANKAFDASHAGAPGPGRAASDEEREGVAATDSSAETPLGVGESTQRSGEEVAAGEDEEGRTTTGVQGPTRRPVGTSDASDSTGVDPKGTTSGGPRAGTGDQGG